MTSDTYLFAFETEEDVNNWVLSYTAIQKYKVVALTAEAHAALLRKHIEHTSINDYYTESDLMKAADDSYTYVWKICTELDRSINVSVLNTNTSFSSFFYPGLIKILRDNFLHASFILSALLKEENPYTVLLVEPAKTEEFEILKGCNHFFSMVLKEICNQRNVATCTLYHAVKTNRVESIYTRIRKVGLRVRNLYRYYRKQSFDFAYYYLSDSQLSSFKEENITCIGLPEAPNYKIAKPKLNLESSWKYFEFGGINLGILANPFLVEFMTNFKGKHEKCVKIYERILSKNQIHTVVVMAALSIEPVALMVAARKTAKPIVMIQHGGFVGYCDWLMVPLIDLNLSQHYFVYGPGITESYISKSFESTDLSSFSPKFHDVGYIQVFTLLKQRQKRLNLKPKVLYVTTSLIGSLRYLAGHLRADIPYLQAQRKVLHLLGDNTDKWDVFFKPPQHKSTRLMIEKIDGSINIFHTGNLVSILQDENFDLIITDAVTTVLLEVLATNAHVVTWFDKDVMKINYEAMDLLKKRADVAYSEAEFLSLISHALHKLNKSNSKENLNDEFIMKYALAKGKDPNICLPNALNTVINRL